MKKNTKSTHEIIIDEMEISILMKSALTAWITQEICLLIFTFVYSFAKQTFDLISAIPLVLAIVSLVVFFVAKICFKNELLADESTDDEE